MTDIHRLADFVHRIRTDGDHLHASFCGLPPLPLQLPPADYGAMALVQERLAAAIYHHLHKSSGDRLPLRHDVSDDAATSLCSSLRDRRSWWHGLRFIGDADDGHTFVEWASIRLRVANDDVRPCTHVPGLDAEVQMPSVMGGVLPGWILVAGRQRPLDTSPQSRLYVNVLRSAAAGLLQDLIDAFDAADLPVLAKFARSQAAAQWTDGLVVQFSTTDVGTVRSLLPAIVERHSASLVLTVSAFVERLAPGIGLAAVPHRVDQSFGTSASRALSTAVLAVVRHSTSQLSWEAVEHELERQGVRARAFPECRFEPAADAPRLRGACDHAGVAPSRERAQALYRESR